MLARQYSFTLSRPGLKPGYYVPARLRIVDTLTILSGVPMVIGVIALAVASLRWAERAGLGVIWRSPVAFCVYAVTVLFVTSWSAWWASIAVLRFAFRVTGMMTKAESQCYPLRADKHCIDPWPEAWQKPEDGRTGVRHPVQ